MMEHELDIRAYTVLIEKKSISFHNLCLYYKLLFDSMIISLDILQV